MICEKTVKKFCKDFQNIENYDKAVAAPEMWVCHHRMELIKTGAVVDSSKQDLIDWGIYYDRPANELVFMTDFEHRSLHFKGRKKSKEQRAKIASTLSGRKVEFTEEHKKNLSSALKGKSTRGKGWKHSEETKHKIAEALKGNKNGVK